VTNPPGLQFTITGQPTLTAPQILQLTPGTYTIAVATTQAGSPGTQYLFSGWSDQGAASHTITVGSSPATYTASFTTQYQLTTVASPSTGGTVTPTSGGFYNMGTVEPVQAIPYSGYSFSGWTGSVATASAASTFVTMNGPQTVTASFASIAGITVATSPPGLQFTLNGGPPQTAPAILSLSAGTYTIAVVTTQAGATGTRYVFTSWAGGGTASAGALTITVGASAATYTANFQTQYLLSTSVSPAGAGTVAAVPSSTDGYYNSGTALQLTATAAATYRFSNWSGDLAGSTNPQSLVMAAPHAVAAIFAGVATQSLTITTSSIPGGLVGVVYPPTAFAVKGGMPPYTWSLSAGTLPGIMSFSSGGVLSGTPPEVGSFPFTVTVTDSSTPTALTAQAPFTLVVTQPTTLLSVSASQLNFSYTQGDSNLPAGQNVGVLSNPTGTAVSVTPSTSDGAPWLQPVVSLSSGKTPGTISVAVVPGQLSPNTYSGQVNISAPNASPTNITVNVTFTVSPSQTPQLTVTPSIQNFALAQGGQEQGVVLVSNGGGGILNYSGAVTAGASWLTLTGASSTGSVTSSTTGSIAFTVNAGTMAPGLYNGAIQVTDLSSQKMEIANVTLLVNGSQPSMQLSQAGLTFFAVHNAAVTVPAQTVSVFNLGTGTFPWTTQVQYLAGSGSWLTVTPSGNASFGTAGLATFTVNPAGLQDGQYYATVNVKSTGAANSPQSISVQLDVVEPGTLGSEPQVSDGGIILAAAAGSTTSVTQALTLFSPAGASLNYSTSVYTNDGGTWLSATPATGTLGAGGTGSLTIQVTAGPESTAVYYGTVQVAFSEGTVQTVQVAFIVLGTAATTGSERLRTGPDPRTPGCTPKKLVATIQSPLANAQLQVPVPTTLQVQILDDCNQPLLPTQSTSPVVYINSSNPQPLSSNNNNGIWTGSWTPTDAAQQVQLTAYAARGQAFGGIPTPTPPLPASVVNVTVLPANATSPPLPQGTLNGASFDKSNPGLVVPGGYVSIFGDRLADTALLAEAPLQGTLGTSQLLLGGTALPLLSVAPGQVNALIPQSAQPGTQIQLVVNRDSTGSVPVSAWVTDLQPGIFTRNAQGTGQGSIVVFETGLIAGPVGPDQAPVSPGQTIEIYATGLGAVVASDGSAPPPDGQPAPASGTPLYRTKATASVTIGGVSTPAPTFSGLSPGYVQLYQVNVQVPANAPTGSQVPLVLTMMDSNGVSVSSPTVMIAVQ
jgi:uncharacterized protein (TIGR03437 family)